MQFLLLSSEVAATSFKDDLLVSYLINRFYYNLINEYKMFRDLDPSDPLITVTFDTRLYYLICGLGQFSLLHFVYLLVMNN